MEYQELQVLLVLPVQMEAQVLLELPGQTVLPEHLGLQVQMEVQVRQAQTVAPVLLEQEVLQELLVLLVQVE